MDTEAPTLGTQIKRARERKRWTQQQLADAIEVSRDAIIKWEGDQRAPRNRIGALEEVLDIDLTTVAVAS
jgi:transcriptional regulator with XRE-family HTH domain